MVIKELKKQLVNKLGPRDAQLLITFFLDISITDYMLSDKFEIDEKTVAKILDCTEQISSGQPLQYVLGNTEFMSLPFNVNKNVLIPRPDTETLVELAISLIGDTSASVIDIGTGSGCIAISIAYYCKNASVSALDVSLPALEMATKNADLNNVRVDMINLDIMKSYPENKYDYLVSNPPYIPTKDIYELNHNVKDFEPFNALDGGDDGLDFYRRITDIAPEILNHGGYAMFEVGYNQATEVSEIMSKNFCEINIVNDLCSIQRVVYGKLK